MTAIPHSTIRNERARALQGKRAGLPSRLVADGIDWVVVVVMYVAILLGIELAAWLLLGSDFHAEAPDLEITVGVGWLILVAYLTAGWAGTGRTPGKSVMGLRVVKADGSELRPRVAFFRAMLCATVGVWLLVWCLVSRRNEGLHDVLLRTAVVYDWPTGT